MTENEALLIATRLYVRMRANGGRVIDAVWITQNADYAREILRLAYAHSDDEVQRLALKLEEMLFGAVQPRSAIAPAAPREPAASAAAPKGISKYIGVLR
ncbi:hypothetical protein [Solimonas marina]|uniref:Uncharacterized protein n=1 Tax=Solimonas marina TaxID=2714601 RepID=A0A970B9U3_9GAMM|nr:hypothetical protein [Solimonas marina]NKF23709.1 hypothetical protein [Solimonas marina]